MAIAISVHSNIPLAYPTPSRTPSLALAYPTPSPTPNLSPNPNPAPPPLPQVHSNMWGKYEDVLVSELEGLPPAQLPISLGVTGLPIRLHDATVGLTSRGAESVRTWLGSRPVLVLG